MKNLVTLDRTGRSKTAPKREQVRLEKSRSLVSLGLDLRLKMTKKKEEAQIKARREKTESRCFQKKSEGKLGGEMGGSAGNGNRGRIGECAW